MKRGGMGIGLAALAAAALYLSGDGQSAQRRRAAATPWRAAADGAAQLDPRLTTVRILFGLGDNEPSVWEGRVRVTEGEIKRLEVWRSGPGDRVEPDGRFQTRTRTTSAGRNRRLLTENGLLVWLDAPADAVLELTTNHGEARVPLAELADGGRAARLQRRVRLDQVANAMEAAATDREEDLPAAAAAGGKVYAVYVEHEHVGPPSLPRLKEPPADFEAYKPDGGGDRLMAMVFDGRSWSAPTPLTDEGLDLWRPAIAADGRGAVWAVWSQNREGNWDLMARRLDPASGRWGDAIRLTEDPGADIHPAMARDASGAVWLAWQGWRGDGFDIWAARLGPEGLGEPFRLGSAHANEWDPAIAADGRGAVYVAYDTYAAGDYDVHVVRVDRGASDSPPEPVPVAATPRCEVRPSLACDGEGRLWIAWEERSVHWGKDDWGAAHRGPGSALYRDGSTVRVACWAGGRLQAPAGDLWTAFPEPLRKMNGFPRLAADEAGRVWLAMRHRESRRQPAGTYWHTLVTAYEGDRWSAPMLVPYSDNLLDNRPTLLAERGGRLLIVYSGDGRNRYVSGDSLNNQLFTALIVRRGEAGPPALAERPVEAMERPPAIHPREREDVARMRQYRLRLGAKTYQLMRGEFHRHTEISGDGGGDGALEDMWRYALDAAAMDWIGNGDHDNGGGREYPWWWIQKTTDIFHHPPRFTPMFTYERSVRYPDGHRNVMFAQRGVRTLPRLAARPEENKPNGVSAGDTPMLYRYLRRFNGVCASHTSATDMGTDWRDNDPVVEPFVEIYQGDRQNYEHLGAPRSPTPDYSIGGYRPAGFVWNALEKGYRLGFQSSSDHISTHISYAIGVTESRTRAGLLEAFQQRHCYAATDNIILIVTCGEHLMGDEFALEGAPTLEIYAYGTQPVARLSIIKDLKYAYTASPNQQELKVRWTDAEPQRGRTVLYYVRIEQADGQIAWASPMWIRCQ